MWGISDLGSSTARNLRNELEIGLQCEEQDVRKSSGESMFQALGQREVVEKWFRSGLNLENKNKINQMDKPLFLP